VLFSEAFLPPGWRFLFTKRFEDTWFDATLLEV
jgi:hypothetical protein